MAQTRLFLPWCCAAVAAAACRPTPRSNPAADTSATTGIPAKEPAVLSPDKAAVWLEGHSYVIRWQGLDWDRLHISAAMGGKDKGHLVMDYPARLDSLTWTIPPGFVTQFGPLESDQMRLRLEDAADPARFIDSETFTVRGDSAASQ